MMKIPLSKKQFEDVLKNNSTPRGISVVVDDSFGQYWQFKRLVEPSAKRAELGWLDYVVGREKQCYHVRILSIKMDGNKLIVETRRPRNL